MDEMDQRRVEELRQIAFSVEALQRLPSRDSSAAATGGNANFNLNAGAAGTYIAATACLMTLTGLILACVFGVGFMNEANAQIRELRMRDAELQAYINAGYAQPVQEEKQK